jgi:hypothetical protein
VSVELARHRVAAVALTAGAALLLILLLALSADDDGEAAAALVDGGDATAAGAAADGDVDPVVAELHGLIERAEATTGHAVYSAGPSAAGMQTVEVWRGPADGGTRRRYELTREVPDGATTTVLFIVAPDSVVNCARSGQAPYTCTELPAGSIGDVVAAALGVDLANVDLAVRDDAVGDRAVRCFTVAGADPVTQVCIDPVDATVVRLTSPELDVTLASTDDDVPENVFEPPAPVTG